MATTKLSYVHQGKALCSCFSRQSWEWLLALRADECPQHMSHRPRPEQGGAKLTQGRRTVRTAKRRSWLILVDAKLQQHQRLPAQVAFCVSTTGMDKHVAPQECSQSPTDMARRFYHVFGTSCRNSVARTSRTGGPHFVCCTSGPWAPSLRIPAPAAVCGYRAQSHRKANFATVS